MQEILITLRYQEKGFITSKRVDENKYLFFEFCTTPEKTHDYLNEFMNAFKTAVKVFSSSKVYDVEVRLESDTTCYFLITQSNDDKLQGVYTVYDYGTKNATNIVKSSKPAILKRFKDVITQVLQDNNIIP